MIAVDWNLAHFAQPDWLWLLAMPPLVWLLRYLRRKQLDHQRYRDYADPALLKYLLVGQDDNKPGRLSWVWLWTLLWFLLVLAMAGPRWDFVEVEFDEAEANLVVLLDISRSMDVTDVSPSRLSLARREIEDLINLAAQGGRNLRIGLVAFASTAHVVAPITDDSVALRQVMPYLTTSLSSQGGSRLLPALREASRLIEGHGKGKIDPQANFLLVTDGDFDEPGLNEAVARLRDHGIRLHVLGVGTPTGGPVLRKRMVGGEEQLEALIGPGGVAVVSRLPRTALQGLAKHGTGLYMEADYSGNNPARLLAHVDETLNYSQQAENKGKRRIWNERFFWLAGLVLLLILPWYWPRKRRSW